MQSSKIIKLTFLLTIGVSTLVIAGGIYVWMFLQIGSIHNKSISIQSETSVVATQNDKAQTIRSIVRATTAQRDVITALIIRENDIVPFLTAIEKMGIQAQTSTTVQSVGIGAPLDTKGLITPLNLSLKVQGTFQQVYYMLSLLESFPKPILVTSARFTQETVKSDWVGIFTIQASKVSSNIK